jgi:ABC-type polar amino acid transport system ATPase subunit
LLRCVNLLEQVTDGEIVLDGEEITDPRVDADSVRTGGSAWCSSRTTCFRT